MATTTGSMTASNVPYERAIARAAAAYCEALVAAGSGRAARDAMARFGNWASRAAHLGGVSEAEAQARAKTLGLAEYAE